MKTEGSNQFTIADYYQKEFEVLSQAHFQTSEKTTSFFQFISLIFLAPFALFAVPDLETSTLLGAILLVIGLLGFCITMYLADLRFESLLYARSVNKIRFSIYSEELDHLFPSEQVPFINHASILLAQPKKPNYFDTNQFLWIVLGLGIVDSFYLTYSIRVFSPIILGFNLTKYWFVFVVVFFCLIHVLFYFLKSRKHESGSIYFNNIIGSDIDGVISNQNAQFVKFFNMNNNNQITQDDIVSLPVHKSGKVSPEDENKVFCRTNYWETLELLPGAKDALSHLRKSGYRIFLFTSRPWNLTDGNIKTITRKWLKCCDVKYKSLTFDNKKKTRFLKAQNLKVKYFIEDDLIKAVKLCSICKAVFLVDYKYNQSDTKTPYNLIRVKDLSEVEKIINLLD